MYKSFREMPVWQKALELAVQVFNLSSSLPRSEDYGLTSQLRRAVNSLNLNLNLCYYRMVTIMTTKGRG